MSPAPEGRAAPYLKASWEAPMEALKGQIGKLMELKDNGPWARFFKDEDAPGEMETMDVVRISAPDPDRVLVDETIDGWRVRLTLPREWKDVCVVENDGAILSFYQKASKQDYGGLVFFLAAAESPVDLDSPEFGAMDGASVVIEKDGAALISAGPTDVQYNDEITELSDEYDRMRAEIPGILGTVEFERI